MKRLTARPRKRILLLGVMLTALVAAAVATTATMFSNNGVITISDASPKPTPATPYPSPIAVSALVGQITDVNVILNDFRHGAPDDVDVLVTSPGGGKVILMGDAGDTVAPDGAIDLTFDDSGGTLPDDAKLMTGTYAPVNYGSSGVDDELCEDEPDPDVFPSPAPGSPYSSALAAFNQQAPNGTWNLYVVDDCELGSGFIDSGWTVDIATNPTGVTVAAFTSRAGKAGVDVRWSTSAETQIAGFNVYRADTRLNQRLIAARHAGLARGAAYHLVDRAVRKGGTYTYRLQVVGLDGKRTWFGATSIRLAD